jgi:hypothetical protein
LEVKIITKNKKNKLKQKKENGEENQDGHQA